MLGGGEPGGGHGAAAGPSGAHEDGGSGPVAAAASAMFGSTSNNNNSGEDDKGRVDDSGGGFGGNRWPRQETLALLKIRSDMDVAFRDASVKGPLWEEVSRKLAELGYHRSAKKCKEKFENVYKYHKRTKEGRTGKQDGKTYRFFDQLEALETHHSISSPAAAAAAPPPRAVPTTMPPNPPPPSLHHVAVPSTTTSSFPQNIVTTTASIPSSNPTIQPPLQMANPIINHPQQTFSHNISSADLMSNSTSSSTSSDVELGGRHKRKRKWKDFFERLMREVMQKQEDMQKKFLEAIEKREHDRVAREEAWRMQEMARINHEREILARERSLAAAKDTAVMTVLQKLSEQQNLGQLVQNHPPQAPPVVASQQPAVAAPAPAPPPQPTATPGQSSLSINAPAPPPPPIAVTNLDLSNIDNGGQNSPAVSSSRWPKVEIEALIKLRTSLDAKYLENGPKGPLWEEISTGMKRLGYNRNSKRCKEKWENINKYFKKVKESNKKRPEDSKTCPYFHQLDALYRERNKVDNSSSSQIKPENSVPLMVRPEQQWPPAPPSSEPENRHDSVMEEIESEHEEDKDGDDEEEDEGGEYEIVASKPVSMGTGE
ncbi:hypothetical protein SLE2022_239840 [Rubroshorea leprosula]